MRSRLATVVCALAIGCGALAAQENFRVPKAPTVTAAPVSPVVVRPGRSGKVEMAFRVEPGFHINSNQPKNDLLKPTLVHLDPPTDIIVSKVVYPPGQDLTFEFLPNEKLNVYTGDFTVSGTINTARTIAPGTYRVHGELRYQACDNRQCYPPRQMPVQFDVSVLKLSRRSMRNPGQSPHVHQ